MPLFAEDRTGDYCTDRRHLLTAARWCKAHPDGQIATGMWTEPTWSAADFARWFMHCLHEKINRGDTRAWRKLRPEYQADLTHDARMIADYTRRRVRHTGCQGLLRTPELRRRYPHIDRQEEG